MCNMQVMQTPPKLGNMFQSLITEHDTLGQRQGPDPRRTRYQIRETGIGKLSTIRQINRPKLRKLIRPRHEHPQQSP